MPRYVGVAIRSAGGQALMLTLWLALVALTSVCMGCTDSGPGVESLSARQAWALVEARDEVMFLDVRTPEEVTTGVIPGAVALNFYGSGFKSRLAELDRGRTYVVYCHSGGRSAATITLMRAMGFTRVRHLGGGIVEWLREGLPLARLGNG
ncbi:MAG: rhodanese-like domain-containing protein [Proteobacteria bacterium]|nr:rhodanese-like domain-containing protein [Pseudomonadota bacterium]